MHLTTEENMEYKIEGMPFKYFGEDALLGCKIQISDFVTYPPEPDCGYCGGIEVKDFDIVGDVLVIDSDDDELVFSSLELIGSFKQAIWDNADWEHIHEVLNG